MMDKTRERTRKKYNFYIVIIQNANNNECDYNR